MGHNIRSIKVEKKPQNRVLVNIFIVACFVSLLLLLLLLSCNLLSCFLTLLLSYSLAFFLNNFLRISFFPCESFFQVLVVVVVVVDGVVAIGYVNVLQRVVRWIETSLNQKIQ